jgi:adenine-specific DNA-methyltransferase
VEASAPAQVSADDQQEAVRITKTELVWPGKYNPNGSLRDVPRARLPFQVIETVNESRATREAQKISGFTLFDAYDGNEGETFEAGWRNKLIWGDNLLVMGSLEKFAGKIDLIYIDPPFATGADFSFNAPIGERGEELTKEASAVEEKAYRDTWGAGADSYLRMMSDRLRLLRDLLAPDGSLFIHCDWHVGHLIRALADETFGSENFLNELIWYYYNKFQGNVNRFASNHDVVFWYRKSESYQFKAQIEKRPEGKVKQLVRAWDKKKGAIVNVKGSDGKVTYRETDERTVDDVWRISMLQPADRTENCGFPTQKPEALLQRIIQVASKEGDLIADFFCGSGTTLAVAEKLGRRWIGCDLGRWPIHVTRKRLLGIQQCKPFELLNLGKYERQYWQGVTFSQNSVKPRQETLFEYLAFILKLYGAHPVAGMQHVHGKKGRAMVHVGAVDAPVTIDEVASAIEECVALKQSELHVLGWEWEMGLAGPNNDYRKGGLMHDIAKQKGIKLLLMQIPREVMEMQAAEKGDVRFFELAYLSIEIKKPKKLTVSVSLKDFVIPNTELIPEEVREKIKKWSDYIDYWAVDWAFQNDTFMQGWVTYRTRKDRRLALTSDSHTYDKPGRYRILVKVVDIFGNDTSQAHEVEVR